MPKTHILEIAAFMYNNWSNAITVSWKHMVCVREWKRKFLINYLAENLFLINILPRNFVVDTSILEYGHVHCK